MDYDQAKTIFQTISASRCQRQWLDLIDRAVAYARIRVDWLRAEKDQQLAIGPQRTACHNALIASCRAMAEAMSAAGEDTQWQILLGSERKTIGDFACFVHCMLGQIAR